MPGARSGNTDTIAPLIPASFPGSFFLPSGSEVGFIYRLTHSASESSGYSCTNSLTMNEKFQYFSIENFEFIVGKRVQVNSDN